MQSMSSEPSPVICPACLTSSATFAFRKSEYDLFRCSFCDFIFVHPFPSDAEIAEHYKTSYRGASADYYPKSGSRRWRAFVRSMKFIPYAGGGGVGGRMS